MNFSTEAFIVFTVLFAGGGLILVIIGVFYSRRKKIIKMDQLGTGHVMDHIERTGLKGNKYYESVIKYRPVTGNEVLLRHFNSRKSRLFEKGNEVLLYYDPARPEKYVLKEDSRARSIYIIFGTIVIILWGAAICALFLL